MEYRLYKSPWKAVKLLTGSAAFVALGLFGLLHRPIVMPGLVSWASIIFFGLGILAGLFHLLDRRPQIIINNIGIFDRMAHNEFINWNVIEDAYLVYVSSQTFICLVIDEQFQPSSSKTGFRKRAKDFSKSQGFQEMNISLGQVNIDEQKLIEFIKLMKDANDDQRQRLIGQFAAKPKSSD